MYLIQLTMGPMLIENKDQANYSFDTISACINTKKNEIVYLETIFLNGCVVLLLFPIVLLAIPRFLFFQPNPKYVFLEP